MKIIEINRKQKKNKLGLTRIIVQEIMDFGKEESAKKKKLSCPQVPMLIWLYPHFLSSKHDQSIQRHRII